MLQRHCDLIRLHDPYHTHTQISWHPASPHNVAHTRGSCQKAHSLLALRTYLKFITYIDLQVVILQLINPDMDRTPSQRLMMQATVVMEVFVAGAVNI